MSEAHHERLADHYRDLLQRSLDRAMAGREVISLIQIAETDFDISGTYKRFSVWGLCDDVMVISTLEEQENGQVQIQTSSHRIADIGSVRVTETFAEPANEVPQTVTVSLSIGGARNIQIMPGHCGDPECDGDHGFEGMMFREEIHMGANLSADGPLHMSDVLDFADAICARVHGRSNRAHIIHPSEATL